MRRIRRRFDEPHRLVLVSALLLVGAAAWTTTTTTTSRQSATRRGASSWSFLPPRLLHQNNGMALFAKKKKKTPAAAALEALEALDALDDDDDAAPMSKKERIQLEKQQAKEAKQQAAAATKNSKEAMLANALDALDDAPMSKKDQKALEKQEEQQAAAAINGDTAPKSKKEQMLQKALEMERLDEERASAAAEEQPKLTKKEQRALEKKQRQAEAKAAKKAANKAEEENGGEAAAAVPVVNGGVNGDDDDAAASSEPVETAPPAPVPTLEDKIRKERPPPRIRVMDTSGQPGFTSLRLENVGIIFRNQQVLKDVTWGVQTGDRLGLVGANGAGKTTQLRILAGELEPTTGDVVKSSQDLRVAMLRQEFVDELVLTRTLKEEFMSVFEAETGILNELKQAEEDLAACNGNDGCDVDRMQALLDRMQELEQQAQDKGVYALESRVKKVMNLMGFTDDEASDLVASFSGGWKMRIGLGKVLLQDPNVLLLDEPTNHLDLDSVEWLEAFLREQNIPMIIVSHDREFLDQVCTKIVDAEGGTCTSYDGSNYSRFLQLKKARMDAWNAAYKSQEKKIKEERQWINKFKVKQPQAVKQRQAKLEKFLKSEEYVQKPPFLGKPFRFRFPDAPRLSPEVCQVTDLTHAYRSEVAQNQLFDHVDLFIEKGDRIAVVGPNGSGKSTLLRLLIGREEPSDGGKAEVVGQNVILNYFEQNQADCLDLDKTVLETIQGASTGQQSYNELRALLGQFLFKGDSVDKKVENLSGGEKARLSLCCMMLTPANLLILDEPTNHLDIPAKEMLEEALQHFAGSILVVSHDRYFISQVATTIVAIEDKKLTKYQGDYRFYMDMSKAIREKVEARHVLGTDPIKSARVVDLEEIENVPKKKKNFGGAKNANMVTRKNKGVKNAKRMQTN